MDPAHEELPSRKLKLLCLHGFLQTGSVFRARTGSLRKALKSTCEFAYLDAPFHAASSLTEEQLARFGGGSDGLSWFCWQDLGPDKRPSLAVTYTRWDESYSHLCSALRQHQPDGLLGFSQGATAVALLLASLQEAQAAGRDLDVPAPKLCIVAAGFLPNDPSMAKLLRAAKVSTPALFVTGTGDSLIPPARTRELMATWQPGTAREYEHAGGHCVPTASGAFKAALLEWLAPFAAAAAAAAGASGAAAPAPAGGGGDAGVGASGASMASLEDDSAARQQAQAEDDLAAALGESRL